MQTSQKLDELSSLYKIEIVNEGFMLCLTLTDFFGIQHTFRNYTMMRLIDKAHETLILNESKLDTNKKNKPRKLCIKKYSN